MKGICLFLLFLFMNYVSTGASFSSPEFEEGSDSTRKLSEIEKLLKDNETSGMRSSYGWPPIWDVPQMNSNFDPHFILVMLESDPRINDIDLQTEDYIGGFYTDDNGELRCGGATFWQDTINVVIKLFADDAETPEKDGFSYAETIYFKFFSWTTLKDYDIDVIEFNTSGLYTSTDKWYPIGVSQVVDIQALVDMDFYISAEDNPLCVGNQLFLSGEEFIGTGGPYTYDWTSDPPGFTSSLRVPPPTTPDETTTYILVVDDGLLTSDHELAVVVNEPPMAIAGSNGSVCANESYSLNGSAVNSENIIWTSSGDGTFDDPTSLTTDYTPGTLDNQNGSATITLIAHPLNPCLANDDDELQLQVLPLPSVNVGDDISACGNDAIFMEVDGNAYSTLVWTTDGDGSFSDPNSLEPQYFPGSGDLSAGEVELQLCAEAITPCLASSCDNMMITFLVAPSCNAPSSRTKCENVPVPMAGSVSNNDGLLWTTQGDGHFVDPSVINTQYIGGVQDRANGGTIVTLNALPIAPCTTPATKDVNVILKPLPIVVAGNTNTVCIDSHLQLDASVDHALNFHWETDGDGNFSSTTSLTAKYYPGTNDLQEGSFELTLLANPINPCTTSISDVLLVDVVDNPSIDIITEDGQVVCETPPFALNADAVFHEDISWGTSGDGSFNNPELLNTLYSPGQSDILSGEAITLTLTVSPISPCDISAVSSIDVTFSPNSSANAGEDEVICETDDFQLVGTAESYSSILWETGGDGNFSDNSIVNPVYTPGTNDIISGEVTLTINALASSPCIVTASDEVLLSIQLEPVINAGNDATICENGSHFLGGVVAQNYLQLNWTTSGDGEFNNPAAKNPIYTPGSQDKLNGSTGLKLTGLAVDPCTVFKEDEKILTIINLPAASAGDDGLICETGTFQLNGTASNYAAVLWETSGDGLFSDASHLDATYTPGSADINAGTTVLTVNAEAINPCTINASDEVTLNIQLEPVIVAGNDATICETGTHFLAGVIAQNYFQLNWTTSGDGEFNNPAAKNPIYTPGSQDKLNGSTGLKLTGLAVDPCTVFKEDEKILTIINLPAASAGDDGLVCETGTYQLDGAATNYTAILWETNGDGSFNNTSELDATYTPGSADISAGSVVLTLNALAINPCSINNSDEITLNIQFEPVINAGNEATICETDTHFLSGVTAEHYAQLNWTTSGDGTFNNPGAKNPVYTPGNQDKLNGSAELKLTGLAVDPCTVFKEDEKSLTIINLPAAGAGDGGVICETDAYQLEGTASNYSFVQWETEGDGVFSNASQLNATYTPGLSDISSGTVTLTLNALAISPCTLSSSDDLSLEIQLAPVVNAGNNATICETETHFLNGVTADNCSSLSWVSSGDGFFNNSSVKNPIYTPGTEDIQNGSATLTLICNAINPCTVFQLDEKELSIIQLATANAGDDDIFCESGTYQLDGAASNFNSLLWETSGNGSFSNASVIDPVYTPGSGDINTGSVTLTLNAYAINPCTVAAVDEIIVSLQAEPVIQSGNDATICETATHFLGGVTVENYSQLNWTTSGDGAFNNPQIKNPVYTPGSSDISFGTVTLTLTGSSISPCIIDVESDLILSIQAEPVINAGNNATICETETHYLGGVVAQNYLQLNWTTSGDGDFNNPGAKNPIYTPGDQDKLNGSAELKLTGLAVDPCTISKEDEKLLAIINLATASAGDDITACGDTQLSGSAANYSELYWASTGDGNFSDSSIPNPEYYPGPGDIANLSVQLMISAQPLSPCTVAANDIMTYSIDVPQIVSDDVTDQEIFSGNALHLEFLAESISTGDYSWYFEGELIEGENSSILSISDLTADDAGYYMCMYSNGCGAVESNEALVQILDNSIQQSILPKGWSGISSYVMPNDPAMEDVFSDVVDDLILISDNIGVYWPAQNINTLSDWSVTTGYQIKMESNAGLNMNGYIRYPSQELTIPSGWSYLPVNAICAVDVAGLFSSMPEITMIKDIAETGIYWPEFNVNTLQMLYPGKAYEIYNSSGSMAMIKYPKCDGPIIDLKVENIEVLSPWNEVIKTPATHVFGFNANALELLEFGDIVGAFTHNGTCAGFMSVDPAGGSQVLVAFANDPLSEIADGFEMEEIVSFKVFRNSTNEVLVADVTYSSHSVNAGLFENHGVSIIERLEFKATSVNGIAQSDINMHIYPNPTSGQVYVELLSDYQLSGDITVTSINGQLVYAADFNQSASGAKLSVDLSGMIGGVYYLRITSDQFTKTEKIILE